LDAATEDKQLADYFGKALGSIGDPVAVPALMRAVKRDVEGYTCRALGRLGDESGFQPLLDLAERKQSIEPLLALQTLVKRSNKKYEPWMDLSGVSAPFRGDDWRKWWGANQTDFKVTRTAAEVFGRDKARRAERVVERGAGLEWQDKP